MTDKLRNSITNGKEVCCEHHFAALCKEWCLAQGYWFDTKTSLSETHIKVWHSCNGSDIFKSIKEESEVSAMAAAITWVAKNET